MTDASIPVDSATEWLETDGLGGFASGTTSGIRTRRYHTLLLAAAAPPADRHALVAGFVARLDTPHGSAEFWPQAYAGGWTTGRDVDGVAFTFDVVDDGHVPGAVDAACRPNQIFAAGGLPFTLLRPERARSVVDAVERELWTPLGLRSLECAHRRTFRATRAASGSGTAPITRARSGRGSSGPSSKLG